MDASDAAQEHLQALIGEWRMEVAFRGAPPLEGASAVFEWILDGSYVMQRTRIPHPDAPDAVMIISVDPAGGDYTQHYFDSRGVTRLYAMTLSDTEWTLTRKRADFSPLDFSQRFVGVFSEDHRTIEGRWETGTDDGDWQRDFGLVYTRV